MTTSRGVMRPPLLVLLFVAVMACLSCLPLASARRLQLDKTALAAASKARMRADPRTFKQAFSGYKVPTSFFHLSVGRTYKYAFTSKAAQIDHTLPHPQKVSPSISLEDMGLFPFAVLEGVLHLEVVCVTADFTVLVRANVTDIHYDCEQSGAKLNDSCSALELLAKNITSHHFWYTQTFMGEIISFDFHVNETAHVMGVKESLVHEISLTGPDLANEEKAASFSKTSKINDTTIQTRYRIRPFTFYKNQLIDGVVVRKERLTSHLSDVPHLHGEPPFVSRRFAWVYMVIGGSFPQSRGASPVPMHVSSTEQIQIDPAAVRFLNPNMTDDVVLLTRLELNLRNVVPSRDHTNDLLIDGHCTLPEAIVPRFSHTQSNPPLSFVEQESHVSHAQHAALKLHAKNFGHFTSEDFVLSGQHLFYSDLLAEQLRAAAQSVPQ